MNNFEYREQMRFLMEQESLRHLRNVSEHLKYQDNREFLRQMAPQCPWCGGRLQDGQFEICVHCQNKLSWVLGRPCKPGSPEERELLAKQAEQEQREQQLRAREAAFEKRLAKQRLAGFRLLIEPIDMLVDGPVRIALNNQPLGEGTAKTGFEYQAELPIGQHQLTVQIALGPFNRNTTIALPVSQSGYYQATIQYSRFWGSYKSSPRWEYVPLQHVH